MMLKIPRRFKSIVFAAVMSVFTVMIVSCMLTFRHYGFDTGFISHWFSAFVSAWPLVFLAILVVAPIVTKWVDKIVDS